MSEPKSPRRPRAEPPGIPGPPVIPRAPVRAEAPPTAAAAPSWSPPGDEARRARQLIRPELPRGAERAPAGAGFRRREAPVDSTGAEAAHLSRLVSSGASVVVRLETGDAVEGQVEWADRSCLKLRRKDGAPILVFRQAVVSVEAMPGATRRG